MVPACRSPNRGCCSARPPSTMLHTTCWLTLPRAHAVATASMIRYVGGHAGSETGPQERPPRISPPAGAWISTSRPQRPLLTFHRVASLKDTWSTRAKTARRAGGASASQGDPVRASARGGDSGAPDLETAVRFSMSPSRLMASQGRLGHRRRLGPC
jgi:hypothetical protein